MTLEASPAVRQARDARSVCSASRSGLRTLAEPTRLPTPCCEVRFRHGDSHMPRKQRQYSLLFFHNLTDSFCRKSFPLISIQIAGWCGPLDERILPPQAQPILFQAFAHSFARRKNSTLLFSFCCALLRENTGGGGTPSSSAENHHCRWLSTSGPRLQYGRIFRNLRTILFHINSFRAFSQERGLWHHACPIELRLLLRGAL